MTNTRSLAPIDKLFIVGLPRSGTSTLVHALRSVGYRGFAEGHLLSLVSVLEQTIAHYYVTWQEANVDGTMLNKVSLGQLVSHYRKSFALFFEKLTGPPPWLDKNASAALMPYLDLVQSMWPEANSAMTKFPGRPFEHFCEVLKFTFSNWERQKMHLSRYIEVDQCEFFSAEALAEKLLTFLQIDRSCRVSLIENLKVQVERTAHSYALHELSELGLSTGQMEFFNNKCGSIMHEYYEYEPAAVRPQRRSSN
jgi:hypothetical protein